VVRPAAPADLALHAISVGESGLALLEEIGHGREPRWNSPKPRGSSEGRPETRAANRLRNHQDGTETPQREENGTNITEHLDGGLKLVLTIGSSPPAHPPLLDGTFAVL